MQLGRTPRVGGEQLLRERSDLQGFGDELSRLRPQVVHDDADVEVHVRVDVREVPGFAVERVAVQQHDRRAGRLGLPDEVGQQQRVRPREVQVRVAEPDVDLHRDAGVDPRPEREAEQRGVGEARGPIPRTIPTPPSRPRRAPAATGRRRTRAGRPRCSSSRRRRPRSARRAVRRTRPRTRRRRHRTPRPPRRALPAGRSRGSRGRTRPPSPPGRAGRRSRSRYRPGSATRPTARGAAGSSPPDPARHARRRSCRGRRAVRGRAPARTIGGSRTRPASRTPTSPAPARGRTR